jgi:hypothetical protein
MNTQFYTTFPMGLIDGMLTRLKVEPYVIFAPTSVPNATGGTTTETRWIKDDVIQSNIFGEKRTGSKKTPTSEYLFNFLCQKDLRPTMGKDIDYSVEFTSPFEDKITRMLLLYKYVAGLQAISNDTVTLKTSDIAELGLSLTALDAKIAFDKMFPNSYVINRFDDKKWQIKLGPRDVRVTPGPGSVQLKVTNLMGLYSKIKDLHFQEMNKPKKQTLTEQI